MKHLCQSLFIAAALVALPAAAQQFERLSRLVPPTLAAEAERPDRKPAAQDVEADAPKPERPTLAITWEMGANDVGKTGIAESWLTITNLTDEPLTAKGDWLIGYCWASVHPYDFEEAELREKEVCASYHILRPTERFRPLMPGKSRRYRLLQHGAIIRENGGPQGAFFVSDSKSEPVNVAVSTVPFSRPEQYLRKNGTGYATADWLYDYNLAPERDAQRAAADRLKESDLRPLHLVPQPKEITASRAAANLALPLESREDSSLPAEGYRIRFGRRSNLIEYADEIGLFYAQQTLRRLRENGEKVRVSTIVDWPDLPHRGLMLDIARNFTPKAEILQILDLMAAYKLNVLHFHLADDEGWRLEIPSLPELTEVGSRRGYTTNEHSCLYPAYSGGWDPKDSTSTANGYLSRTDYVDIVRYAQARHIRVIPEIDMPGHSRAAIVAMEERYRRYSDLARARYGERYLDKAEEFRLIDPNDRSVYSSAQHYTDDVICIARESCYRFAFTVINEMAKMHEEAGQPLTVFHVGGDEVANGAFERSPLCISKMQELGFTGTHQLKDWFLQRLIAHLAPMGIQIAGWEEIAMHKGEPNPVFADKNVLSWCWNSIPEWRGDEKPYLLANAGYPVVLACVGNNYLDMSYTNHHQERGLHWGGYTDERSSFDFLPFDIYRSVRYTMQREPRDIDAYDAGKSLRLKPDARKNIIGINGQLFAETIRSTEQLEQYLFPKLIGLAERAWNATPVSLRGTQGELPKERFEAERVVYLRQLYAYELPRLHQIGIRFHLAQPGIRLTEGSDGKQLVVINCPVPQAEIRYTTDGSEPTALSPRYSKPLDAAALRAAGADGLLVRARAFYLGEQSNTTSLF